MTNEHGNGNGHHSTSLKGKVALVTGGARGIGRAIALNFAECGASVAVNYLTSKSDAEVLAAEIQDMGVSCILVPGDVAVKGEARKVVQAVLDELKRLDILVNNAGITRDKSIRKMADDDWVDVINVNLNGTFYCTSAALPGMIEQKFGRIINIASYVGQAGSFGQANYAASKGGIIAFTRALAFEMAKYNVTANCIAPGYTCTEMMAKIPPAVLEQIRSKIPMGRFANPVEIAKAATFLAADGDYITGQQLNINGGIYM